MRTRIGISALSLTVLLAATAAAQAPPIDDLPPLPHPPTTPPAGGQKARFRVVVEGDGDASREVTADGSNGACQITSRTRTMEEYEYGRGRGLEVVFTRFRGLRNGPVWLRRVGRSRPGAEFNVRGWYRLTAQGQASRSGQPAEVCQPVTDNVGDESDCNRRIAAAVDVALLYEDGDLRLEGRGERTRFPTCGTNSVETLSQAPLFGWAGFPTASESLPASRIFGRKRRFLLVLGEPESQQRTDSSNPAFPGQALDRGHQRVVVRFTRL